MAGPGGKSLRVSNTTRLVLLGMMPLFANGERQGMLGREEADGRGFLRNGSGRHLQSGAECGIDFPGVRSSGGTGKICCVKECGQCGGEGCSDFGIALGYSGEHCCTSDVEKSGVVCSESMAAPCILASSGAQTASTPKSDPELEAEVMPATMMDFEFVRCSAMEGEDAGEDAFFYTTEDDNLMLSTCYEECVTQPALYFAVLEGNVCACGDSAGFLDATAKPLGKCDAACPGNGAETCGGSNSYNLYKIVDGSESKPESDVVPTCSSGIVGVESESGDICCDHMCGTCGGDRCVGSGECCEETIQLREEMCSDTNAAPCIYNKVGVVTPQPAPVPKSSPREQPYCSDGLPGVASADGKTCCWDGCLKCDGYGEECVGVTGCCEQAVHDSAVFCSDADVVEGPCIM